MSTFWTGWCSNIAWNNIIKNKENFTDEETWWKVQEREISGKEKVHYKKFRIEFKDEVEDIVSQGESKFVNGRWELAILLLFSRQKTCLETLIDLLVVGKALGTLCDELTYFTALHTFKVSVKASLVKNMGLAEKETWWWP